MEKSNPQGVTWRYVALRGVTWRYVAQIPAAATTSQYFYWEALDLSRRIILTGAILIVRDSVITIRLVCALMASLIWLTMLFSTYPFRRFQFNVLSIVSAFTIVCIYLGALLVKLHRDLRVNFNAFVGARLTADDVFNTVVDTMSFHDGDSIVTVIIIFTAGVVLLVLSALGQRFWDDSLVQTFRVNGEEQPELQLNRGDKWHLVSRWSQIMDTAHPQAHPLRMPSRTVTPTRDSSSVTSGAAARIRCRWSSDA